MLPTHMIKDMIVSTIIFAIFSKAFVSGQSQKDIANNPNNFLIFENFEFTK